MVVYKELKVLYWRKVIKYKYFKNKTLPFFTMSGFNLTPLVLVTFKDGLWLHGTVPQRLNHNFPLPMKPIMVKVVHSHSKK